jgi:hypothetical protein
MAKKIISIPAAARTFGALGDLGHNLNSAVADVIDNSISRGKAKNISVFFYKKNDGKFVLKIYDNGIGMTEDTLEEAMRLGSSDEDYEIGDLSKYGMGMKTASLSQCHKLTVISKFNTKSPFGYEWDMHHVKASNEWDLMKLSKTEITLKIKNSEKELNGLSHTKLNMLESKSWTLVMWDDLKEFQKDYDSYNSTVTGDNYFYKTSDNLSLYLRIVFGRFLSGENGARKTKMFYNGSQLHSFDPFCRNEKHTSEMEMSKKNSHFDFESIRSSVIIKRFILPTKNGKFKFSSENAWAEAKGIKSWNDAQGYYIYRNNRLITFGGWYGTKGKDEHDKLARVSIDITQDHDHLFTLDVNKTRIKLPEILKNHLIDHVNKGYIKVAKQRYSSSESKKAISNNVRGKNLKVDHLSNELIKKDNIIVSDDISGKAIVIKNKSGKTIINDTTYKTLKADLKIISEPFKDDSYLWKMIPHPENGFQVLINENHPFYSEVYGNHENDKKTTAIMDAFLFTMSFIELKCITQNNEMLFDQMREVASLVLKKFIEERIL